MTKNAKLTYLYWLPAVLWGGLIFMASHLPITDTPPLFDFPGSDKVIHFVIFGILSIFILTAFVLERKMPLLQAGIFSLMVTSLYGALDEWHQSFIPERSVEVADWLADTFGGLAFLLLVIYAIKALKHQKY